MLTRRERQVTELLAKGLSRQEIAAAQCVTVSAIDKLVHSLKAKFGAGTHAMLVLRCTDYLRERTIAETPRTEGALVSHSERPANDRRQPAAEKGPLFDPALGFDDLFTQLRGALARFGVTHLAYSHIRSTGPGLIAHITSRWAMPAGISFDFDIAPSSNPTFAYAMSQWAPLPLDLAALQTDATYLLIPEPVRRQHEQFIAAGLVRGVIWPLPGPGVQDRLVLSTILRHASADRLAEVMAEHGDRMRLIALDFRNAHVAKAKPRHHLTERESALLDCLADGLTLEEAGAAQGISRRAAERCIAAAREVTGAATLAALVALHLRNRSDPVLPF
jgi:DNA-binding CsgD family transcriptional regulator